MKKIVAILVLVLSLFGAVQAQAVNSSMPTITAKMLKDKRNVQIVMSNLGSVKSVSYEMTYFGSGNEQGVFGSVKKITTKSLSRTLYLGTCSYRVCTPHKKISNIKVSVSFKLKSGESMTRVVKI